MSANAIYDAVCIPIASVTPQEPFGLLKTPQMFAA
jgi:hypothetical protein